MFWEFTFPCSSRVQCLSLLGSGTSLKHLFLPFGSFLVVWPGLNICCWRDNAVASDRTRLSRWPGKGPEQDSWQLIYQHQINSLMPRVGCGCSNSGPWEHSTPVTQKKLHGGVCLLQLLVSSAQMISAYFFSHKESRFSVLKLCCQSSCFCKRGKSVQRCYGKYVCVV